MPSKILVVDDDPGIRHILNFFLKREGHVVIQAVDGVDCLKKVESEKPDMVILDVMMPGMGGWEVCKKIKAATPHLPVSMCSVLGEPEDIEESLKSAGADEHLTKPLDFNKVLDFVNSF